MVLVGDGGGVGRGMGRECEWMTVGKNGVESLYSFLSSPPYVTFSGKVA